MDMTLKDWMQAISTVKNGLICPACFSLTSYACIPDTTTHCTGNEIECATYSMHNNSVTSGPYIIMVGCTTANLCTAPIGVMSSIVIGNIVENITCFNPTGQFGLSTTTVPTTPAATSSSIFCVSCSSESQALCSGPLIQCPAGEVCTSTYTETVYYGQIIWTLVRGCGKTTECNQPKTVSNQFMTVSMNTGCCSTSVCTPTEPVVQAISTVKNGLTCPSCFSLTSYACIPDTRTVCTGNEIQCATYSMHNTSVTSGPYIIMLGCATANLCTEPNGVMSSIVIGNIIENITCYNPSGSFNISTTTVPTTSAATSARIFCVSCSSESQTLCSGPLIQCPAGEVCTSTYTETQYYGQTIWTLVRGCGQTTECNQPKTVSNEFMSVSMNTGCCSTTDCIPAEPVGKYL
ncbi:uncharacterized protein [Hyperolius riggenbachi]|uniref:uncharacterized protein n=1 Tax=Hyperolius riggenbachi TaxID=752182 RepID=UPI0035A3B17D